MKNKMKLISLIALILSIVVTTYLAFTSLGRIDDDIFAVDFDEDFEEEE